MTVRSPQFLVSHCLSKKAPKEESYFARLNVVLARSSIKRISVAPTVEAARCVNLVVADLEPSFQSRRGDRNRGLHDVTTSKMDRGSCLDQLLEKIQQNLNDGIILMHGTGPCKVNSNKQRIADIPAKIVFDANSFVVSYVNENTGNAISLERLEGDTNIASLGLDSLDAADFEIVLGERLGITIDTPPKCMEDVWRLFNCNRRI